MALAIGINRNIMECKAYPSAAIASAAEFVLIETLWNVKSASA